MTLLRSEDETLAFAKSFANQLSTGSMLLLEGGMSVGKTCFVRGLCEGLGGDPLQVSSPTFTIMQEYIIGNNGRLIHIDAYRLSGVEELESIGWDELLADTQAIIAIEWPSRIKMAIPDSAISLQIEHVDINTREIN